MQHYTSPCSPLHTQTYGAVCDVLCGRGPIDYKEFMELLSWAYARDAPTSTLPQVVIHMMQDKFGLQNLVDQVAVLQRLQHSTDGLQHSTDGLQHSTAGIRIIVGLQHSTAGIAAQYCRVLVTAGIEAPYRRDCSTVLEDSSTVL
jgi:hypothetical protein